MTIHDILVNCGSVNSKTYVAVATFDSRKIVWGRIFQRFTKESRI